VLKKRPWLFAIAAMILVVTASSFFARAERVHPTRVRVYVPGGAGVPRVALRVEAADAPGDGGTLAASAWAAVDVVRTDARGEVSLPSMRALRFFVPVPYVGGPRGFVNRVRFSDHGNHIVDLGGEASAMHVLLDQATGRLDTLVFQTAHVTMRGAFGQACEQKVLALSRVERYLDTPRDEGFGRRVREVITTRALALGMTPHSPPQRNALVFDVARGVAPASNLQVTVLLRDRDSVTPPGFASP
jgi:hypothetical protein